MIRSVFFAFLLAASPGWAADPPVSAWLARPIVSPEVAQFEMGQYLQARTPSLPAAADWSMRKSNFLRSRFLDEVVFKGAPREWANWKARVEYTETLEPAPDYRIRKLRYEALPGLWIPAALYEPTTLKGKVPVVLNVNGHVGPPGKAIEYEQIRCIHLARCGMIAIHPEWFSFGELGGKGYGHNTLAYLDLVGVSGLSTFFLAMRGGVDALLDHPNADPARVAMTGLSGGGWQTITLSSLDPRITLSAPNAGYIGLDYRVEHRGDIGDVEQNPTDMMKVGDYTLLTALLAPRPTLLIYNEKDECCFPAFRAKASVYEPLRPFFAALGAEDRLAYHMNSDPGTHNYELDNRRAFYQFVFKHFFPDREPVLEETHQASEIHAPESLYVGVPEGNATFPTMAARFFPARYPDSPASSSRARLREVLRAPESVGRAIVDGVTSAEGWEGRWVRMKVDHDWTVPVVDLRPSEPKGAPALLLSDGGRVACATKAAELAAAGRRVVALDPLFLGESVPGTTAPWQYGQMFATVGERPLGIQVAQVMATAAYYFEHEGVGPMDLYADGQTTQVVALCAAALAPGLFGEVSATNGLVSLRDLIERDLGYERASSLFCFGLLQQFDIPQLQQLAVGD